MYTIEDFAEKLRQSYPHLADNSATNIDLVKSYFEQYPDAPQLAEISDKDMLFASAEPKQTEAPIQNKVEQPKPEAESIDTFEKQQQRSRDNEAGKSWQHAEDLYRKGGSQEAPGFLDQIAFNLVQQVSSMPSAIVGMTGWAAQGLGADETGKSLIDTGENLRKWGQDLIQDIIEDNTELQVLQVWNEDEEITLNEDGQIGNFWHLDIAARSLASAIPSMVEMAAMSWATGGMASLGHLARGGKAALTAAKMSGRIGKFKTAGGVGGGIVMEGSETWNTAMAYGKEQGMSNEEAANVAGVATSIAAPIKGSLEYLGFGRMARGMGLKEVGNKELSRLLAGKVSQNMLVRGGVEGLKNATQEGTTEWLQFMTDAMVQEGYKNGYDSATWINQAWDVVKEEGWSAEARASVHGGFMLGKVTGFAGGTTKGFGRHKPENIAKRIKEVDVWADEVNAKFKNDPNGKEIINASELIREERYHQIVASSLEGMNEEQRNEFMDMVNNSYTPKGFAPGLGLSHEATFDKDSPVDAPVSDVKYETNEEKDHKSFLDSLIDTKSDIVVPNLEGATDEQKESSDYKFWKGIKDSEGAKPKDRLLKYIKEAGQSAILAIDKHKDADVLYTRALRAIYDRNALGASFNFDKIDAKKTKAIVQIWAEKGDFSLEDFTDIESGATSQGTNEDFLQSLSDHDLAVVMENQDFSNQKIIDEMVNARPSEDDMFLMDEEAMHKWIEESLMNPNVEINNDDVIEEMEKSNKLITKSISEELVKLGIPVEEHGKLTEDELNNILNPTTLPTTVKEMKQFISDNGIDDLLPKQGSGANGNYLKKDYQQAIDLHETSKNEIKPPEVKETPASRLRDVLDAGKRDGDETYTLEDLEKSASLEERTVEEITAFMQKQGHKDWTDKDSQGNKDYDIKNNELYKSDPIAYLENLIKIKEESIGYFEEGKAKDSYIKTNSLRKDLLKQMKEDKKLAALPETDWKAEKKKLKAAADYQGRLAEGTPELGKSVPIDDKRTGDEKSGFTGESPESRLKQLEETVAGRKPAFMMWDNYSNAELFREIALSNGLIEIKATPQVDPPWMTDPDIYEDMVKDGMPTSQVSVFVKPENKKQGQRLAELHGENYPNQQVAESDTIQWSDTDITEVEFHREVGELLGYSKEQIDKFVKGMEVTKPAQGTSKPKEVLPKGIRDKINKLKNKKTTDDGDDKSVSTEIEETVNEEDEEKAVENKNDPSLSKADLAAIEKLKKGTNKKPDDELTKDQKNELYKYYLSVDENTKEDAIELAKNATLEEYNNVKDRIAEEDVVVDLRKVGEDDGVVVRDADNRKLTLADGTEIQYNNDQQAGYDKITNWVLNGRGHFGLQGYAGTGKSTLITDIINFIHEKGLGTPLLAAPTHKAVGVVKQMGSNAETLASVMELVPNPDRKVFKKTGSHEFVTQKSLDPEHNAYRVLKENKNGFIIIDESSMIDDNTLKAMLPILAKFNIKAIYIGDDAQLPPVGQYHSSAFKLDKKDEFQQDVFTTHELTMVERQAKSSPLFKIYNQLRKVIGSLRSGVNLPYIKSFTGEKNGFQTDVDENGNGLYYTERIESLYAAAYSYFTSKAYQSNPNLFKILTGTKKAAQKHNNNIRNRIFDPVNKTPEQFYLNEWLVPATTRMSDEEILFKNSYAFEILESKEESRDFHLEGKTYNINGYALTVRDGVEEDGTDTNKRQIFLVKNENPRKREYEAPAYGQLYDINSNDAWLEAYNTLKERFYSSQGEDRKQNGLNLDNFEMNFVRQFRIETVTEVDGKLKALYTESDLDYNYSSTVHKAQGSSYTNVAVDESSIQAWIYWMKSEAGMRKYIKQKYAEKGKPLRDITDADERVVYNQRDRMLYTALTRPREKLFIYNSYYKKTGISDPSKDKEGEILPPLGKLPPKFEYQTEGDVKYMPSYTSDLVAFSKIRKRLKKHFPNISTKGLETILKKDGSEALGRALGLAVEWSKSKATMDTVPHEYAHIYLNLFSQDPVIKKMIAKYGNEELAIYMGEFYANTITGGLKQGIKVAVKNFWLRIKKQFKGLTSAESKEYIAGSFFRGKKLGVESVFAEGQWDFNDSDDQNIPEYQGVDNDKQGDNPADKFTKSFFIRELKARITKSDYGKLSSLAQEQGVYADFLNGFIKFINENYPAAKAEDVSESFLREFWNKSGNKIHTYNASLGTGQLHLEAVRSNGSFSIVEKGTTYAKHSEVTEKDGTIIPGERRELVNKSAVPDTYMKSFVEMDGVNVITLSLKDISDQKKNFKTKETYWNSADNVKFKMTKDGTDSLFIEDFETSGYIYVASKGGDHAAILFTKIPKKYENMTYEEFEDYVAQEHFDGNLDDNLLASFMEDNNIDENSTDSFAMGKVATQHDWWKSVKYPRYLMGTHLNSDASKPMGVQDHYDRIKMDFQSGYTMRDFGESSIMTVNAETSFFKNKYGDNIPLTEMDGWILSSGAWFKKLSDSLGKTKNGKGTLDVIKGAIRARHGSGNNINYIGLKGLQMRPFQGMEIVDKDGNLIAKYIGTSDVGRWIDSEGSSFEHLSPTDSSKMTEGEYSEFNKIKTLPEGYQKITQREPHKTTSAYPVTQAEMGLNNELLKTPIGKEWFQEISNYYDQIIKQYSDELTTLASDPKALYKVLKKDIDEGDILPELQKRVQLIGPDGKGLLHPSITPMWKEHITNKFIKNGLFKLRNRKKNMGTQMYYKPFYSPAFNGFKLEQGDFISSSKNEVMFEQVFNAYKKATQPDFRPTTADLNKWLLEKNDKGEYINNVPVLLSRQPITKITGVVLRNIRKLQGGGHGQTMFLTNFDVMKVFDGDWDGDKGMISILDSPKLIKTFQKFEKSPEFKKLMKAVNLKYWGKQLQDTSLSNQSEVETTINNINGGMQQIGAITNARNTMSSMHYKNVTITLPGGIVIKPFKPTDVIIMDYMPLGVVNESGDVDFQEQFNEIYNDNNDSIVSETLGVRKKVKDYSHFLELQADKNTVFYLQTTKQNEMAIILQMAVDDSKWGLLGSFEPVAFGSGAFMNNLMFDGYDKIDNSYAKQYISIMRKNFNLSGLRQGYDVKHDKMNLEGFFEESRGLKQFDSESYRVILHNQAFDKIVEEAKKRLDNANPFDSGMGYNIPSYTAAELATKVAAITAAIGTKPFEDVPIDSPLQYDWKPTLQEKLLLSLSDMEDATIDSNPNPDNIQFDIVPLYFTKLSNLMAHRRAQKQINVASTKLFDSKREGFPQKEIDKGKAFAKEFAERYFPLFNDVDKSIDFSEDIEELVSEFMPRWTALSEQAQVVSTVTQFIGTISDVKGASHKIAKDRMNVFFPVDLMQHRVAKTYYELWHDNLMHPDLNTITDKNSQDIISLDAKTRQEGIVSTEQITKDLKRLCE